MKRFAGLVIMAVVLAFAMNAAAAELVGEYSAEVNGTKYKIYFTDDTVMDVGGGLVGILWEEKGRAEGGIVTTSQKTLYTPYWIYDDIGWPTVSFDVGDQTLEFYIVEAGLLQVPDDRPLVLDAVEQAQIYGGGEDAE